MSFDKRLDVVINAALSKKASKIKLIDVAEIADFTNILIFMCGTSDRHNKAISEGIEEAMRLNSDRCLSISGLENANWILLDYGDLIINVMSEESRNFYDLESLWCSGKTIEIPGYLFDSF